MSMSISFVVSFVLLFFVVGSDKCFSLCAKNRFSWHFTSILLNQRNLRIEIVLYCIVLYLDIYIAPLAVMTIQRRFQREHSEETEKFSSNGQRWKNHLPKSQPEFVGEGCSTNKDPQLQMRGVEQWLSWSGGQRGQLYH